VTKAIGGGLSARSTVKYHVMLHGVFKRAVRDRVTPHNLAPDLTPSMIPTPHGSESLRKPVRFSGPRDAVRVGPVKLSAPA
jgi:hypothetical protein